MIADLTEFIIKGEMTYVNAQYFGENLFDDDWMNFPFNNEFWGKKNPLYGKHAQNMMKTDIRETDGSYELDVDLPGFKKR